MGVFVGAALRGRPFAEFRKEFHKGVATEGHPYSNFRAIMVTTSSAVVIAAESKQY